MVFILVLLKLSYLTVRIKYNCCSISYCFITQQVVLIELLLAKVDASFKVTTRLIVLLLLKIFKLSYKVIDS